TLGSRTGRLSGGTGTMPQASQYTTGIGVPQYPCREIPQALRRYCTVPWPMPRASAAAVIFPSASAAVRPLNSPDRTSVPGPSYGAAIGATPGASPGGCTTTVIG